MDIILQSWDSQSLLLNHLAQYPISVVIGMDVEAPRGYYSCSLRKVNPAIQMGIIVNQQKIPSLLSLPSVERVLVGHDQSISMVDLEGASLFDTILLEGVFFEFLHLENKGLILVLHELGCVALSEQSDFLWKHTTDDILEDWNVIEDHLKLTVMDSDIPVVLSLEDGALI